MSMQQTPPVFLPTSPTNQEQLFQFFRDLAGFEPEETAAFLLWAFTNQDRNCQIEDLQQWFNKRLNEAWDDINEEGKTDEAR